jgi:hypothetical protein
MATLKLTDGNEVPVENNQESARLLNYAFNNSGHIPGQAEALDWSRFVGSLKDTVAAGSIKPLLTSSIEITMRESVEPLMPIHTLFDVIQARGMSTQVVAGAIGAAFHAADVGEQGTYPEATFTMGGGMQTAMIGKCGIQQSFTDDALRYANFDLMGLNLREMAKAMKRHKENKARAFLRQLGVPLFDNADPTSSLFGICTGRGLDMAANGALTMDDLLKAVSHSAEQGYVYDLLIVHPTTYLMFQHDPVMRNLFLMGQGGSYFGQTAGNPGPLDPWGWGNMGPARGRFVTPVGAANGDDPTGNFNSIAWGSDSRPVLPSYGPKGITVLASAMVPFDESTGLSDAYFVSSGNVGMMLVDEGETKAEWYDQTREVTTIRMRERYGFAIKNDGMGVGLIKNLKVVRNYWDGAVHAEAAPVEPIDVTTAVV